MRTAFVVLATANLRNRRVVKPHIAPWDAMLVFVVAPLTMKTEEGWFVVAACVPGFRPWVTSTYYNPVPRFTWFATQAAAGRERTHRHAIGHTWAGETSITLAGFG